MTIKSVVDIPILIGSPHPVPIADKCKDRRRQRLGHAVGLDQFGVNRVELDPGVWSTVKHWHTHEEEFVMVLEGELTLVSDDGTEVLHAGDFVGFKAGVQNGHRLENRSEALAVYLEVGSNRPDDDEVDYSEEDLVLRKDKTGTLMFMRRDGSIISAAD